MKIEKMLFVTEFEELWFDALQSLMDLRQAGMNHVIFLHVIDRDKVAMHRGVGYEKTEEVKLKEIANVRFIDWAESLFEQGMEVGAHIVVGKPVPKIVSISEDDDVDLIVTGYHKRGKLIEIFSDSEIMEALRRSSKPILVHKYKLESGKTNDKPFERPILAMDWSPASQRALQLLICLKSVIKKVQVVHVAMEKDMEASSAMEVQKVRKDMRGKLEETCDILRAEGIDAEEHLYVGDTAAQLEKAAQERQASMIVIGATGKGPWKERLLGSVPKELTEESEFSIMIMPPGKED